LFCFFFNEDDEAASPTPDDVDVDAVVEPPFNSLRYIPDPETRGNSRGGEMVFFLAQPYIVESLVDVVDLKDTTAGIYSYARI
jgi:hypothetical protein